jgi:Na+/proline symporter
MFCYIGLLASEIVIGYGIISAFIPGATKVVGSLSLLPGITVLMLLGIVAAYTALAGFRGVVMTDEFQLTLILIMLLGIAWHVGSRVLAGALILLALLGVAAFLLFRKDQGHAVSQDQAGKTVKELHIRDVLRDLPLRWLAFLTFVVVVLIWLFSYREIGHPINIADVINPIKDPPLRFFIFFIVANILFWLVWWPAAMDQWHRCAATTNSRVSRHWLLGTLGILPTFYLGLLSLTFLFAGAAVAKTNPEILDPLAGFLGLLWDGSNPSNESVGGMFLFLIVAMGILAAMISTVDTYLVVATQTLVADVREARRSGRTLHDIEAAEDDHREMMPVLRKTVVILFIWAAVLAFPLLALGIDIFATIYFFFSGMLVLAGALLVGFFVKNNERRNRMGGEVKRAMCIGMGYVVLTNIPIITMLQLTLGGTISGDAWYCQYNNWYYAVYINPVLAMFVTMLCSIISKSER